MPGSAKWERCCTAVPDIQIIIAKHRLEAFSQPVFPRQSIAPTRESGFYQLFENHPLAVRREAHRQLLEWPRDQVAELPLFRQILSAANKFKKHASVSCFEWKASK